MKNILVLILFLVGAVVADAQQQVMFTQYMFNGLAINPAYAGSHETLSAAALMRQQWTGLEGAPATQTFALHSPIHNQKMALGALFLHDKIGVTNQTGAFLSYAYKIPFSNGGKLSLGIQGGVTHYNARFSLVSQTDPTFQNDVNVWHPNAGAGIFYSTTRFYAGFSVPQLIQKKFDPTSTSPDSKMIRHYFATAGYVFDIGENFKLKPNTLVKYVAGAPIEIDLNANLLIKEIIWVGISWRSFDSFDALFQLQLSKLLQIGYAYDFATTTDIRTVNNGSHEFMLLYRIPLSRDRVVSPRYF